jgi:hypothetical protein
MLDRGQVELIRQRGVMAGRQKLCVMFGIQLMRVAWLAQMTAAFIVRNLRGCGNTGGGDVMIQ